jgi:hypothetical protein
MSHPDLTIHQLTESDHAAWDAFVFKCPEATFFHQAAWQGLMEDVFGHRTHFL